MILLESCPGWRAPANVLLRVMFVRILATVSTLCRLTIPEESPDAGTSRLHPVLLDACLQVMGGATDYPADATLVPTGVESFFA